MADQVDVDFDEEMIEVDMAPLQSYLSSPEQCIESWKEKFSTNSLTSVHFKEWWRVWVPRIYSPPLNGNCLEWSSDTEKAEKYLFNILVEFICDGDPLEVLTTLTELNKPAAVCGRVFKMGEPTYNCRECGMDSTCVLCVDCFKQSAHRNHKYKMGTSIGGGCCDCGDDEAWKNEPYCDIHIKGKNLKEATGNILPADLSERARISFDAILWYAYNLLTLEHNPGLPADLKISESERTPLSFLESPDVYCVVLYNDETHTFEQVISTLARVIKCSQRDAIEFVTNIDREGRAVVKCSSFQHCSELKEDIEKYTSRFGNKPLKVLVVHSHVVAHQLYAIKLLEWLTNFLANGEGFRTIFSKVACEAKLPDISIVEGILLRDSQMWKSARSHWHHLLISGMLMEYESKKALAKIFTKNYGHVMKDFIRDDHDHSFSVSSLSVQLYTVPTLAHHLIANEDVLFILLNTFISECSRKCNSSGKLAFERNASTNSFKRAQFMLYDIKYLLSSKPKEWTDKLRRGFLQGLSIILNLLTMMQGMDSVSRQVGQHIDFEPEWESAFNLHIKLAGVITLALEWCGSDTRVLVKAYKATLKKLYDNPSYDTYINEVRELADHAAICLQYDVSTQPVSIHLPLTRFLAGLHLYLEAHSLNFDNDFQTVKPTPEQIMEPVLRTQAMISQVNAGMWRRNGYALLNQLYFYHNVKCRTEMLDRDVILLQIAASLIESNEFLIHVINKFNLFNWANPCFEEISLKSSEEDSMRQTINLVEEFLSLLINVVGERFVPGIGKVTLEDRIKNEIIQQLCIKPLPHSELIKTIPEEILNEAALDSLIDEVATFKKPVQGSGKGVYELKSEFYDRYNVFFYHYTREELSKSEEVQRKRRKADGKLECCPPPDLPELCESFSIVANLLQCDVMLHIMRTVLQRSNNLRARSFSEPQVHKVLHLIGYALQEQESKRYPFLVFTERANKWDILPLLEELASSARVESHKDLLVWTLNKYKDVTLTKNTTENAGGESSSFAEHQLTVRDTAKDEKEWRAKMAAQKRAKLMAQMTTLQNNFMKEMAQLLPENSSTEKKKDDSVGNTSMDMSEVVETPICLGAHQTPKVSQERHFTCILCQEEQIVSVDGEALVLAAFVQQSTVLCQQRNLQQENVPDEPLFLPSNLGPAPYTSTCGHVMHSVCWQKYFDNVAAKESRRPYRLRHPVSFDVEKEEYLCPLCECLSNTILPLTPPLCNLQTPALNQEEITFSDWIKCLRATLHPNADPTQTSSTSGNTSTSTINSIQDLIAAAPPPPPSGSDAPKIDYTQKLIQLTQASSLQEFYEILGAHSIRIDTAFENNFATDTKEVSESFKHVISLYARTTYIRSFGFQAAEFSRTLLTVWNSCAYTIRTMEMLLRDLNKSLLGDLSCRQRDCLESLVRVVSLLASTSKHNSFFEVYTSRLLGSLLETSPDNPSFLDWDTFGILVPLVLSFPSYVSKLFSKPKLGVIPTGGIHDYYIFQLVYLNHITKILLVNDLIDSGTEMEIDMESSLSSHENELIIDVYKKIKKTDNVTLTGQQIWNFVKDASIPFLRCCILFFHFLTDVPAPSVFSEIGGDTFTEMMKYLGFTDSCEYWIRTLTESNLASIWCNHPNVVKYQLKQNEVEIIKEPAVVNRLVTLPVDYSELINTVSLFTCPNSDREDSRNPTMCLVCGEMLCSQSYCCQTELNKILVGACTYHAHKCGAGVGIFLRVRECEVLFLASPNRGCFVSSPYLDNYGETDQGLRRGNPLHLSKELYKKLHTLWLSHGLHEEIARALESTNNLLSTQWQHL